MVVWLIWYKFKTKIVLLNCFANQMKLNLIHAPFLLLLTLLAQGIDTLTVSTGQIRRKWVVTGQGLKTISLTELLNNINY